MQLMSITDIGYPHRQKVSPSPNPTLPRPHLLIFLLAADPTTIEAGSQGVAHLQTSPQEPRFNISRGNSQSLRRFFNAEVLYVPKHKHFSVFWRERRQGALQSIA